VPEISGAGGRARGDGPAPVQSESLTLTTDDGVPLAARWWNGTQAARRTIVCLSGLAAPQDYLRFFAGYLAQCGWGVLTFDYRGIGGSRAVGSQASLDDWVEHDIPAAVAEAKRRSGGGFLGAFAHSIGGQLLGQNPARGDFDGALLFAAQRGIPRLYSGVNYLRVQYAYTLFPFLIGLLGRLPVSRWTLPQRCPGPALLEWVRWGRSGVFTNLKGENVERRFRDWRGPLVAVDVADDDYYAPRLAVDALARVYPTGLVRRETLVPADFGLEKLGHFGFFHPRAPRPLWARAEAWLAEMVPRDAAADPQVP
jgi:predicted alpha/beta hydrolase